MRKSIGFILLLLFFLVTTGKANAATITYAESPQAAFFTPNDEVSFKIKLSINTSNDTNYYLRGVFYKKDTNKYCGYTWNNSVFFKGPYSTNEGWKQFLKATIKDDAWEGEVKTKIDNEDAGCKESGEYGFKIQRFTESGSASFDTQDEKILTFAIPTPLPSQSPIPSVLPTAKSTKAPTNTLTKATSAPSVKPSTTITPTIKSSIVATPSSTAKSAQILGINEERNSPTPSINLPDEKEKKTGSLVGKIVIIVGSMLLATSCGILMYKRYLKEKKQKTHD